MSKKDNMRAEIYEYISDYIAAHAYPPALREIAAAVGLASVSTVHIYLKELVAAGLITMTPAKQRSIALTNKTTRASGVPLVGSVAAGVPILAFDNIQEYLQLPADMLRGSQQEDMFLLKVAGVSMIDAGIFDGDMILVDAGASTASGDIVVARVLGDTATVKRLFTEKEKVRLQPENPDMQPIYVDYADVEIVGKVIGLLRRY